MPIKIQLQCQNMSHLFQTLTFQKVVSSVHCPVELNLLQIQYQAQGCRTTMVMGDKHQLTLCIYECKFMSDETDLDT